MDDIHHPYSKMKRCMEELFNNLKKKYISYDITKYGHSSGTGLVLMNTDIKIILE